LHCAFVSSSPAFRRRAALSCAAASSSWLAFISGNGVLEFALVVATSPVPVAAPSRSILAHPPTRNQSDLLLNFWLWISPQIDRVPVVCILWLLNQLLFLILAITGSSLQFIASHRFDTSSSLHHLLVASEELVMNLLCLYNMHFPAADPDVRLDVCFSSSCRFPYL
jgi:hypothetical protein